MNTCYHRESLQARDGISQTLLERVVHICPHLVLVRRKGSKDLPIHGRFHDYLNTMSL